MATANALETTYYVTHLKQTSDFFWYRDSGLRLNIGLKDVNLVTQYEEGCGEMGEKDWVRFYGDLNEENEEFFGKYNEDENEWKKLSNVNEYNGKYGEMPKINGSSKHWKIDGDKKYIEGVEVVEKKSKKEKDKKEGRKACRWVQLDIFQN